MTLPGQASTKNFKCVSFTFSVAFQPYRVGDVKTRRTIVNATTGRVNTTAQQVSLVEFKAARQSETQIIP